ncbi:hypothetical protein BU15DRAFT_66894 [Melanogaster broomeanus]|nr:hypothetical protein BU15DRAFT_66894 [Melanogaster broomeanus]
MSQAFSLQCGACGCSFAQAVAFTIHMRACTRGKKHLSSALSHAKESYQRKKRRLDPDISSENSILASATTGSSSQGHDLHLEASHLGTWDANDDSLAGRGHTSGSDHDGGEISADSGPSRHPTSSAPSFEDDSLPLSLCRTRRLNRQLPQHFRDMLPEPPMPLPPSDQLSDHDPGTPLSPLSTRSEHLLLPTLVAHIECAGTLPGPRQLFNTQPNSFGLFRSYDGQTLPLHDPEDSSGDSVLPLSSQISQQPGILKVDPNFGTNPFHLYPNESSLQLGIGIGTRGH